MSGPATRPSRPPRTSAAATSALVLAGALVAGALVGQLPAVGLAIVGGAVVGGAVLLGRPERGAALVLQSACFLLGALVAAASPGVAAITELGTLAGTHDPEVLWRLFGAVALAAAAATAGLGAATTWRQDRLPAGLGSVLGTAGTACLVLLATLAVVRTDGSVHAAGVDLAATHLPLGEALLAPDPESAPVGSFLVAWSLATVALSVAVGRLPVAPLVGRERRPAVRARLERGTRALRRWAAVVLAVGVGLWLLDGAVGSLVAALPGALAGAIRRVVASPGVRAAALWVAVAAVATVAGIALLRRLSPDRLGSPRSAAVRAGVAVALAGTLLVADEPVLRRLFAAVPDAEAAVVGSVVSQLGLQRVVLVSLALALCAVGASAVAALALAARLRLLPARTPGPALAAGGLGAAGAVAGWLSGRPVAPFLLVALAVVVWDVGEFGAQLRRELGDGTATRRVELVHVGAALSVGVVAALLAAAAHWLVELPAGGPGRLAGLAALVGVVMLLLALSGSGRPGTADGGGVEPGDGDEGDRDGGVETGDGDEPGVGTGPGDAAATRADD